MTLLLAKLTFPKTQSIKKALLAGVHSRYMSAKFIACRQRLVQPMFNIGDLKINQILSVIFDKCMKAPRAELQPPGLP